MRRSRRAERRQRGGVRVRRVGEVPAVRAALVPLRCARRPRRVVVRTRVLPDYLSARAQQERRREEERAQAPREAAAQDPEERHPLPARGSSPGAVYSRPVEAVRALFTRASTQRAIPGCGRRASPL